MPLKLKAWSFSHSCRCRKKNDTWKNISDNLIVISRSFSHPSISCHLNCGAPTELNEKKLRKKRETESTKSNLHRSQSIYPSTEKGILHFHNIMYAEYFICQPRNVSHFPSHAPLLSCWHDKRMWDDCDVVVRRVFFPSKRKSSAERNWNLTRKKNEEIIWLCKYTLWLTSYIFRR